MTTNLNKISQNISEKLVNKSSLFMTFYVGLAAFSTYTCMYAFRKPFTVALFEGIMLWGLNYKVVLVILQLLGYTAAKGYGIKFISEVKPEQRPKLIIGMVLYSHLSLLMFSIIPAPDNWPFMFLNGIGLGMIYGLIFSYLEGRKITELLSAFLVISFIVSSGFMKTIGSLLINSGVDESKMPFVVGLIFMPIFLISVFALVVVPKPSEADIQSRSLRPPMDQKDRGKFLSKYGFGLYSLIAAYIFMTIFRDIRDNFSAEIWKEIGQKNSLIFSKTEIIIGLIIAINIGIGYKIKDNKLAFFINHLFIILGCLLIFLSTRSFLLNYTSPFWWMVLSGLGIYMAYIPFNGVLFDRLLAVLKEKANVGFLFYMADFAGYLGAIFVMLTQVFSSKTTNWLELISNLAIWLPIVSILFVTISLFYFNSKSSFHTNSNKDIAIS
ncbi:MAG: DUF5690 family protein [Bacteroidota bacterium]